MARDFLTPCPICGSPDSSCGDGDHATNITGFVEIPAERTPAGSGGSPMVEAYATGPGGGRMTIRTTRVRAEAEGLTLVHPPKAKSRTAKNKARTPATNKTSPTAAG
jgi:hypothetical protein